MIYAIRCINTDFIKFGRANSVGKRLNEIDTCCPHELEIAAISDWPDGSETAIHKHLRPQRIKGEWFKDSDSVARVIGWMLQGQPGLDELRTVNKLLFVENVVRGKSHKSASHTRTRTTPERSEFDMGAWLDAKYG